MIFTINNTTGNQVGPYNGTTIAANGTLAVADNVANAYANDPQLISDLITGVVTLTMGGQTYSGMPGAQLLLSLSLQFRNVDSGSPLDNFTKTATGNGGTQQNFYCSGAIFTIVTSAVSGTSPTLTAQLQYSYDGGTTWVNVPGAVTASITTGTTTVLQVFPGAVTTANQSVSWVLPKNWRFVYTIGGTNPSFTIKTYASYV